MQLIKIVFLFLIVYGVSCFQIKKPSPSAFYNQLEELFQAYNQNETDRVEDIFKILQATKYPELDELIDKNATVDYARDFHNYVVRWLYP